MIIWSCCIVCHIATECSPPFTVNIAAFTLSQVTKKCVPLIDVQEYWCRNLIIQCDFVICVSTHCTFLFSACCGPAKIINNLSRMPAEIHLQNNKSNQFRQQMQAHHARYQAQVQRNKKAAAERQQAADKKSKKIRNLWSKLGYAAVQHQRDLMFSSVMLCWQITRSCDVALAVAIWDQFTDGPQWLQQMMDVYFPRYNLFITFIFSHWNLATSTPTFLL